MQPTQSSDPAVESVPHPVPASQGAGALRSLSSLAIDVGIPLGSYYLLHDGLGLHLWLSLALSSIGPAIRSVAGLISKRELNLLALLMLVVNVAGLAVSFITGNPRAHCERFTRQ
jgi:hypothetical protein